MILKKLHLSLYVILVAILFTTQSCEKKKTNNALTKPDVTAINDFLATGQKHYKNEEFDSSYYYYNKAKNESEIKKDTSRIIHSLAWMAQIQRVLGDYSGSEATAVEALPFLENNDKYPNGRWNIYNQLGNNYLFTYDNANALYYFNKALKLKTDPIEKASMKNNIALVYMKQGKYLYAIQTLSSLILKKEVLDNEETYTTILGNLGYCYYKVGSPIALKYLNKSVKIWMQKNDDRGLIGAYYYLSEYYKKNDPNLSNKYIHLAYEKATKVNHVDDRLECLAILIHNSPGNKSKEFSTLYLKINDSIKKVRQKAKNQFAKIKYDFKKERDENVELKAQKLIQLQQQKNKNLLIYFIVVIAFLIALFIYYFLTDKNKRERVESAYSTEVRIAKKLHDELANDVYQTMVFAETQDLSTTQNKEKLLGNLDTIYSRTRNISQENSAVETGIHFLPNIKSMMSAFNTDTTHIIINGFDTVNWGAVEKVKKIALYRVLQELLVNMKKHSKSTLVVLSLKTNENKIFLNYTDNGIGILSDKINFKNGLQNVENRIHAIKGIVTFDTQPRKGFKININFPI